MTQHHDPVHPDSSHLSAELVADLDEGLLDADSATHAEHHLAHCADCRALRADLFFVSAALASLPTPAMPADVAASLDAALAGATPAARAGASDTVVPITAARSRRAGWSTRGAGIAASVAGVLLVSAVALSVVNGSDGSGTPAAEGAATTDTGGNASELASFVADQSGQAYRTKTIDRQVDTLLVSHATEITGSPTPATRAVETDPVVTATVSGEPTAFPAPVVDPRVLYLCVVQYLQRPDTQPLAADIGTFDGSPAAIVVLPSLDDPSEAEVYVVAPDCAGPEATLLYWAVVDLPEQLVR